MGSFRCSPSILFARGALFFLHHLTRAGAFGKTAGVLFDQRCIACIDVDVYFHVVAYDNGTIYVGSNQTTTSLESLVPMIEENMKVLNYELNETPFVFHWKKNNSKEIPMISNSEWTGDMCNPPNQVKLNSWSFLGNTTSINVYLGHKMFLYEEAVGCSSFPGDLYNGISMEFNILPPIGNGLTLVHEVGHWFGLQHTFYSRRNTNYDPCDPVNAGDFVDDTPNQLPFDVDSYTNETSLDSCPDRPGEDSFWNIMNKVCRGRGCYGDRAFLTEGQIQRMYLIWLLYREREEVCGNDQFVFGAEFSGLQFYDQVVVFDETGKEVFDLVTTWNGEDDCSINLCLVRNTSYFAVSFNSESFGFVPSALYSVDGEIVKVVEREFKDRAALVPINWRHDSLSRGNVQLVYEAPSSGCNSSNEALLEVRSEIVNLKEISLYDMDGRGKSLFPYRFEGAIIPHCVPRDGHYALLVLLLNSDASNYTILVDGLPRGTVGGPFFNPSVDIYHSSVSILAPSLLADSSSFSSSATPNPQPPSSSPSDAATLQRPQSIQDDAGQPSSSRTCKPRPFLATVNAFFSFLFFLQAVV